MNLEQLESLLDLAGKMTSLVNNYPLGLDGIKDKITDLEDEIHGQLMILVYERYRDDLNTKREAGA